MTRSPVVPAVIAAGGVLTAVLVVANVDSPLRPIIIVPYLLVGPGLALLRPLGLDLKTELTLSVAASLAIEVVVNMLLLFLGWWTYGRALAIVLSVTGLGLFLDVQGFRFQRAKF